MKRTRHIIAPQKLAMFIIIVIIVFIRLPSPSNISKIIFTMHLSAGGMF